LVYSKPEGLTFKDKHPTKEGMVIFPNHGSDELGKGLEMKLRRDAQL